MVSKKPDKSGNLGVSTQSKDALGVVKTQLSAMSYGNGYLDS